MIQTQSYTTEAIEKGVVLVFDAPGNSIRSASEYFYYFDVAKILPKSPAPIIAFDPPSGSYSMVGDKNFKPKIAITVKSVHSSECKILCRLIIKDKYNYVLYTAYLLITTIPKSSISFNCTLLAGNVAGNIGPDGGSILTFNDAGSVLSEITPGMTVTGPGIPEDKNLFIRSFIGQGSQANQVELSELIPTTANRSGVYTFTRQTKCVDPTVLEYRETVPTYTVLNKDNNWTYAYNDKIIAKFVREDLNDETIVVFLPVKNIGILPDNQEPSIISNAPIVKIAGRVSGDAQCVCNIVFE